MSWINIQIRSVRNVLKRKASITRAIALSSLKSNLVSRWAFLFNIAHLHGLAIMAVLRFRKTTEGASEYSIVRGEKDYNQIF